MASFAVIYYSRGQFRIISCFKSCRMSGCDGNKSDSKTQPKTDFPVGSNKPDDNGGIVVTDEGRLQYTPGWEEEFYKYKRSLKIPPKLISIGRPLWHRKSTSLPDLDPQHSSDASETFGEMNKRFATASTSTAQAKCETSLSKTMDDKPSSAPVPLAPMDSTKTDSKSKSIIDLLHQRVIRPPTNCVKVKKPRSSLIPTEPKILPQSSEAELLPTPGSEGDVFKSENVFETAVLTKRTRKEYKAMKRQEIIREVFGCEDRPASAPPLNVIEAAPHTLVPISSTAQSSSSKLLTFDQQYEQYLEKMNVDYGEKIRKVKSLTQQKSGASSESGSAVPKVELMDADNFHNQDDESQDTELNECARAMDENKEEACDSNDRGDTPSVMSDRTSPTSFSGVLKTKKSRANRHSRRKGSSGKLSRRDAMKTRARLINVCSYFFQASIIFAKRKNHYRNR